MNPGLQAVFSKALNSSPILLPTKPMQNSRKSNSTRAEHPPDTPSSPRAPALLPDVPVPARGMQAEGKDGCSGADASFFWGSLLRYCHESCSPALPVPPNPPPIVNLAASPPGVHLMYEC